MPQTAVDAARSSAMLNAMLPVGTAGVPGSAAATLNAGAMFLLLTSTASTGAAAGTQITNGTGYTTNGLAFYNVSNSGVSAAGSNVTMPGVAAMSWTSSGSNFLTIVSLEIQDHVQVRGFFGNWTGQPIAVASGNKFSCAVGT